MSLNESEALGRTVSEALWTTLGENERLGPKVDDTLFDIRPDTEASGCEENAGVDCKLFDVSYLSLRVIELEKFGLTDVELFAMTFVDVEALELQ